MKKKAVSFHLQPPPPTIPSSHHPVLPLSRPPSVSVSFVLCPPVLRPPVLRPPSFVLPSFVLPSSVLRPLSFVLPSFRPPRKRSSILFKSHTPTAYLLPCYRLPSVSHPSKSHFSNLFKKKAMIHMTRITYKKNYKRMV